MGEPGLASDESRGGRGSDEEKWKEKRISFSPASSSQQKIPQTKSWPMRRGRSDNGLTGSSWLVTRFRLLSLRTGSFRSLCRSGPYTEGLEKLPFCFHAGADVSSVFLKSHVSRGFDATRCSSIAARLQVEMFSKSSISAEGFRIFFGAGAQATQLIGLFSSPLRDGT